MLNDTMPMYFVPEPKTTAGDGLQEAVEILALFCTTLPGARSIDLKTNWDLMNSAHRRALVSDYIHNAKRFFFCPPCTLFSTLMHTNWERMSSELKMDRMFCGVSLLEFTMWVLHSAKEDGKPFIFEHPVRASSWTLDYVKQLATGCYVSVFDQCMFGLRSPSGKPIRKRTAFLTNHRPVHEAFNGRLCEGGCTKPPQAHLVCQGSEQGIRISRWSEVYPAPLARAVVETLCTPA